jgi:hypothetical protein
MTHITFRGDGHYVRPEAMAWCGDNGIDYIFGLPGTKPLIRKVDEAADIVRTTRAIEDQEVVRGYAEIRHKAGSWIRAAARSDGRSEAMRRRNHIRRALQSRTVIRQRSAARFLADDASRCPTTDTRVARTRSSPRLPPCSATRSDRAPAVW